jgi:hypothetical protein
VKDNAKNSLAISVVVHLRLCNRSLPINKKIRAKINNAATF